MWENNAVEIDKMTVKQLLDYLTDINYHTERCVIETIIDGRLDLMEKACEVWQDHIKKGYLTDENGKKREEIYKELEKE